MKNTRIDNIKFDYITFNDRYYSDWKKTSYQVTLVINEKKQVKFQFVLTENINFLSNNVWERIGMKNAMLTDIVNSLDLDCLLTNNWNNFYESTKILAKD